MEALVWLALMIVFIIVEIATLGLASIWFAFGAIAAFICALFHAPIAVQIVAFFLVSFLTLLLTRPVAKRWMSKTHKTNYQSVIGERARVTEKIDNFNSTGAAFVNGLEWTARSSDDSISIEVGEIVNITDIQGVKIIVERVKED